MAGPWTGHFAGITWSGGDWGVGNLEVNDSAPEEAILYQVHYLLQGDSILNDIFGDDRIEAMEIRNAIDFRNMPRLQVYLGNLDEDQQPTRVDENEVSLFIGVRFEFLQGVTRLEPGAPTVAAVIRRIKNVIKADAKLLVQVNGVSDVPLAVGGGRQEGGLSYLFDVEGDSGRIYVTAELNWTYPVEVDHDTGKILNVVKAGG